VKVGWRVRALDAVMARGGLHIADAHTVAQVQELRERRKRQADGSLRSRLLGAIERWLFGRPRREVRTEDRTLPGPHGPLPFRLYRPPHAPADAPLIVNLHGGGWVLGDLDGGDWLCSTLAADVGAVVASVDYRLAPEHPAPAAVDDCVAATRWFDDHRAEVGASGPLAVMGDSAGGNLATLVALAARDAGGPAIAAQVLIYPAVDLTRSFPSHRELADAPILSQRDIDAFCRHYLGDSVAADDPRVSPWFVEDLSGCAPALVQLAEQDPLRDEGRAYAERLRDAGVEVRLTEYVGLPHGYASVPGLCGRPTHQAVAEIAQFLRQHLR
jgi:acetyl esterase